MNQPCRKAPARLGAVLLLLATPGLAATSGAIEAEVRGTDGQPAGNAVVWAERVDGEPLPRPDTPEAVMDQRDREFVPHVLPVLRGTSVRFPNSDDTRHHVYSFSEARTFELRLYHGKTAQPVTFDRSGVVTLGCNIHDWMLGYIRVLDTPAFARTGADGQARIEALPPTRYRVRAWHPRLADTAAPGSRTIEIGKESTARVTFELALAEPVERGGQRGFGDPDDEGLEEAFER